MVPPVQQVLMVVIGFLLFIVLLPPRIPTYRRCGLPELLPSPPPAVQVRPEGGFNESAQRRQRVVARN